VVVSAAFVTRCLRVGEVGVAVGRAVVVQSPPPAGAGHVSCAAGVCIEP
jgi:hypothetical protein